MENTVQPLPFELNLVERCGNSLKVRNGAQDSNSEDCINLNASASSKLQEIVDLLGEKSARVQGLKNPITCLRSFLLTAPETEQRLYIVASNRRKTNESEGERFKLPRGSMTPQTSKQENGSHALTYERNRANKKR